MELTVYSLKGVLYQGQAISVTLPTPNGQITVLDHHQPLLTLVAGGQLLIRENLSEDSSPKTIDILSGFLEVSPDNHVRFLVEN